MTELSPGILWTDARPMRFLGAPVGRRCAVVRSAGHQLFVFSPVRADAASIGALRQLGEVGAFILPSRFHDRFYEGYFRVFPQARFLAARPVMTDHPGWPLTELVAGRPELSSFDFVELKGMPWVREHLFCHRPTRTLFVADALFNIPTPSGAIDRLIISAAQVGGRPRVCRTFRTMIRDREAFSESLAQVFKWDFDRIVPGHGDVIETGGKEVLRNAYSRFVD